MYLYAIEIEPLLDRKKPLSRCNQHDKPNNVGLIKAEHNSFQGEAIYLQIKAASW